MEPASLALSFAAIVGLMADFASSRGRAEVLDIKDFTEWLRTHGHNELLEEIQKNNLATISIKASLAEGRSELIRRLTAIESLLAALASSEGPLGQLAVNLVPETSLSEQAIDILVAFERAQAGKALLNHTLHGASLVFLDAPGSSGYAPMDPRFFEADLEELVKSDLCALSFNQRGGKLFQITRRGSKIARSLMATKGHPI